MHKISKRLLFVFLVLSKIVQAEEHAPKKSQDKKKQEHAAPEEPVVSPQQKLAEGFVITQGYVHMWEKMPVIQGVDFTKKPKSIVTEEGYVSVVFFIASWCVPCQNMMKTVLSMKDRYEKLSAKFYFVFSHDLASDAQSFAEEYGLTSTMIANHDVLKAYHNPQLPSIYIADRDQWLAKRIFDIKEKDLKEIDELLFTMTGY